MFRVKYYRVVLERKVCSVVQELMQQFFVFFYLKVRSVTRTEASVDVHEYVRLVQKPCHAIEAPAGCFVGIYIFLDLLAHRG